MDSQYFIEKFEAIPEGKWCEKMLINDAGQRCANGHCGVIDSNGGFTYTKESIALYKVFRDVIVHWPGGEMCKDCEGIEYSSIAAIINNGSAVEYQQDTPKQRILAALKDIQLKEQQDKAVEEVNELVAIPLCPECGKPANKCECESDYDEEDEADEEDWGAGEALKNKVLDEFLEVLSRPLQSA